MTICFIQVCLAGVGTAGLSTAALDLECAAGVASCWCACNGFAGLELPPFTCGVGPFLQVFFGASLNACCVRTSWVERHHWSQRALTQSNSCLIVEMCKFDIDEKVTKFQVASAVITAIPLLAVARSVSQCDCAVMRTKKRDAEGTRKPVTGWSLSKN